MPHLRSLMVLVLLALSPAAGAGTLSATVKNDKGEPIEGAVVYAVAPGLKLPANPPDLDVDQVNKEFVPHVSAVPAGTSIRFPNYDQIRHHVYSFSKTKSFEIPLYKGIPADPIVFDEPGIVSLGCNIHDWMAAYVFVSETPYFSLTDASGATHITVPDGDYEVRVWHPTQKSKPEDTTRKLSVGGNATAEFSIKQKRVWKARRGGGGRSDGYR